MKSESVYQGTTRKKRTKDQGDVKSASRLATMLFRDTAAAGDVNEAIRLWTWAADKGDAYAQYNLAQIYLSGTGVSPDFMTLRCERARQSSWSPWTQFLEIGV